VAKGYKTQWIGQFAVASELTRRNYLVSIPLGNTPIRDILCQSPKGKSFSVQVKSLSSKGFFPFQSHLTTKEYPDLYFIFVCIPNGLDQPLEFFIMSHKKLLEAWKKEKEEAKKKEEQRGMPYKEWSEGISYKTLLNSGFKDWSVLPD
jgi:hypothetical protein